MSVRYGDCVNDRAACCLDHLFRALSDEFERVISSFLFGTLSPADGEACTERGPAAGECPEPVMPAADAGHPNITYTELHCAAFAVRDYGEQCATEFARKFWGDIADKLNAAAAAKK
ncbi:hypothetical protein MM1218R_01471 [Mycobacterium marinum]|nr:hypothetical protein MM1218R_01471 [Mycobacterium marinum]RFZ11528.1 hypothetical protein DE4381_01116 [Mycobacterium marinum]